MTSVTLICTAVVCILSIKFHINAETNLEYENGNHKKETERIAHGIVAPKGKYPFVVAIYEKHRFTFRVPSYTCSGSILNSDYIITACHCIRDERNQYLELRDYCAVAGNQDININTEEQQITRFLKFIGHPHCDARRAIPPRDIGLIQVEHPFEWNNLLKPLAFISTQRHTLWWWYSKFSSEGKLCNTPGWGKINVNATGSPLALQEGTIELITVQDCSRFACYLNIDCEQILSRRRNICGDLSQGSSPCRGDSGSPLVCDGFFFGVHSGGPRNCKAKEPEQTYIKIPVYYTDPLDTLEFIQQNVPNYKGSTPTFDHHSSVPPFKYPFVVSIANVSNKHIPRSFCAASILTVSSVLSTCRCLQELIYSHEQQRFLDVAVISGVTDLFEDSLFAQQLDIIKIHIDYSCTPYKFNFLYDSGIAVLKGKFPLATPQVKPLLMVTEDISKLRFILTEFQKSSLECVMATWGYRYDHPTRIRYNVLSEWKVRLYNTHKCQRKICGKEEDNCYEAFNRTDEICGEAYNFSQPCFGDRGGPLICRGYYFGQVTHNSQLCTRPNTVKITSVVSILQMIQTQFPEYEEWKISKLQASAANLIPLSASILRICFFLTDYNNVVFQMLDIFNFLGR